MGYNKVRNILEAVMKLNFIFPGFLLIVLFIFSACDLLNDSGGYTPNAFETKVLELTNIERANNGLPALTWNNTLASAARDHSKDMMQSNTLSHTGSDGSTLRQRVERTGISNWSSLAENVAAGQATPEAVVTSWMNSSGHRANILNANLTHLGVGFVERPEGATATYKTYWTQKFCAFK